MNHSELLKIINIVAPIFSASTAFIILGLTMLLGMRQALQFKKKALLYLACAIFNWVAVYLFFFYTEMMVYVNWLSYFTFLMAQVFLYGFIFEITRIDYSEKFSRFHYLLPVLFSLTLLLLSLTTPYSEQLFILKNQEAYRGGSYAFFAFSNSKLKVRLIFSLVYTIMAFVRLRRYRIFIKDYSSNNQKSSLHWVKALLFCSVALIPIPLLALFFSRESQISSFAVTLQVLALTTQYAFLCYYLPKNQYVVLDKEPLQEQGANSNVAPDLSVKKDIISREALEEYMNTQKPYLNPDLKITDIVRDLGINRTYLSAFINNEFGVNFSIFINQYRLAEFNVQKNETENQHLSMTQLAGMSGFSSLRTFKRFQSGKAV